MIALAAPAFPWPGYQIPSKVALADTRIQVLLLRANDLLFSANDLRFRAEKLDDVRRGREV